MEYVEAASILARRQAILAYMMPFMISALVILILVYLASAIAMWNIFVKAGEKGWKGFVPFYNTFILFKISWSVKWFWTALALFVVAIVVSNLSSRGNQSLFVVFLVITIVCAVALFLVNCLAMYKLSFAFGKGAGFTVGLIFLNIIFMLILGFGSSKYELFTSKENAKKVEEGKLIKFKLKNSATSKSEPKKKPAAKPKASPKKESPKKDQTDYIDPKQKINF